MIITHIRTLGQEPESYLEFYSTPNLKRPLIAKLISLNIRNFYIVNDDQFSRRTNPLYSYEFFLFDHYFLRIRMSLTFSPEFHNFRA